MPLTSSESSVLGGAAVDSDLSLAAVLTARVWRRRTLESARQALGSDPPPGADLARVEALHGELTRFAARGVSALEAAVKALKAATAGESGFLSTAARLMDEPLPVDCLQRMAPGPGYAPPGHTGVDIEGSESGDYEAGIPDSDDAHVQPARGRATPPSPGPGPPPVGDAASRRALSELAATLGADMEARVLSPVAAWLFQLREIGPRVRALNSLRLETDARRRGIAKAEAKAERLRARLVAKGPSADGERRLERAWGNARRKEAKLAAARAAFCAAEAGVFESLAALARDSYVFRTYIDVVVVQQREAFASLATPTLDAAAAAAAADLSPTRNEPVSGEATDNVSPPVSSAERRRRFLQSRLARRQTTSGSLHGAEVPSQAAPAPGDGGITASDTSDDSEAEHLDPDSANNEHERLVARGAVTSSGSKSRSGGSMGSSAGIDKYRVKSLSPDSVEVGAADSAAGVAPVRRASMPLRRARRKSAAPVAPAGAAETAGGLFGRVDSWGGGGLPPGGF